MKTRFHWFPVGPPLVLSLIVATMPTVAAETDIDRAIRAAYEPNSTLEVLLFTPLFEIASHRFGVAPAEMKRGADDTFALTGKLMYQPSGASAESIEYRVLRRKAGAPVQTVEIRLGQGGWKPLSPRLMTVLHAYRAGRELTLEQQQAARRQFEAASLQTLNGTWQRAAEYLVARIAVGDDC
jgi:hypothetical protein